MHDFEYFQNSFIIVGIPSQVDSILEGTDCPKEGEYPLELWLLHVGVVLELGAESVVLKS